jgi:hypothetical protein
MHHVEKLNGVKVLIHNEDRLKGVKVWIHHEKKPESNDVKFQPLNDRKLRLARWQLT